MRGGVFHIPFKSFYIVVLLVLPCGLYSQQRSVKLYNINDGLPGTGIGSAYQDKYGYLWIYTDGGPSRFDGRQFVNYGIADGLPVVNGSVFYQDSRERFWAGTTAGAVQFKNNRFINYPTSDHRYRMYVFNFFETKSKQIWALTNWGVYEFAGTQWKKISLCPGFDNEPCRNIIETNGNLYVNYTSHIVCRDKKGKWRTIASNAFFNVMSLQDKRILVSAGRNIYEIADQKLFQLNKKPLVADGYFSYLVDSKKRLWLASDEKLNVSEPNEWIHLTEPIDRYKHHLFVYEDSSQNVWTSAMEGLIKIKDRPFTIIDKNKLTPLDGIYNIIRLPGNKLIFSSGTTMGLLLYANNRLKSIKPPSSAGSTNYYRDPVDCYAFDDDSTLWLVTRFKRLLRFNGKSLDDFSGVFQFKTNELIYDMLYNRQRKQFFVCGDSTLLYGNPSKLGTFIPKNTGQPIVKPTRLLALKNGLLLVYVAKKGVFSIDSANNLTPYFTTIDNSKYHIQLDLSFYEGTGNSFWIVIPGLGMYEYGYTKTDAPFLKNHFSLDDGLQSNNISSMTIDRHNRVWVASNSGIDILQLNKAGHWEIFNYTKALDMNISVGLLEKLTSDSESNIWLSSPGKVIKFNEGSVRLNKKAPRVIIEKVSLAFKETDWPELTDSLYSYFQLPYNPVLNYSQNSLGIFFNAIDLSTSNSNPEYSYKLLPVETSWSNPSKIKSVSFSQLPAGKYQFIVRAKDLASGWSKPAIFRFTITPPFWNEWWFRLVIVSIAAFTIIVIFRRRIRKIKNDAFIENQLKELEMKALKAQMNPHFIYNALNSIQALVANDKKEEGIRYIGSFSRLLRQVLDNSEKNVISLDKELESIGLYIQLESLRLDMQLRYKKDVSPSLVAEFEKIPPLILQPFVENALWHGLSGKKGEKEITIAVSEEADWLLCDIIDNGIGRARAMELKSSSAIFHESKGIDITLKRLIDFNADDKFAAITFFDLYDNDNHPSGTRVSVRIKRKFSSRESFTY